MSINVLRIDMSINSPAFTIIQTNELFKITNIFFYSIQGTKKWVIKTDNVQIIKFPISKPNIYDKIDTSLTVIKKLIEEYKVDYVAIEGAAIGSEHPLSLITLSKASGVIEKALYDLNKPFVLYPPRTIKRFATGNGNAQKAQMIEYFTKEKAFGLFKELDWKNLPSMDDLVDSYWIAYILMHHVMWFKMNNFVPLKERQGLNWKSNIDSVSIIEMNFVQKN